MTTHPNSLFNDRREIIIAVRCCPERSLSRPVVRDTGENLLGRGPRSRSFGDPSFRQRRRHRKGNPNGSQERALPLLDPKDYDWIQETVTGDLEGFFPGRDGRGGVHPSGWTESRFSFEVLNLE